MAGGERAGKSRLSAVEPVLYILEHADKPDKLIWIVGGIYEMAKPEFGYAFADLQKLGLVEKSYLPRLGSQEAHGPGYRMVTKSSDDVLRIAAEAPDFVLMAEAAQQTLEVFLRLRGRVAEKRGYLIASGCLVKDTMIATDEGLLELGELIGDRPGPGQALPCQVGVHGLIGPTQTTLAWDNGAGDTLKVSLSKGISIEGTPNHRVIARLKDGSVTWCELSELETGQLVAIRYGANMWGDEGLDNPYLLGLYMAEGCCSPEDRITITTADKPLEEFLASQGFLNTKGSGYHWRITNHALADYWRSLGVDPSWKARTKEVPLGVRQARREDVIEFLRGQFDGDGTVRLSKSGVAAVRLDSASEKMIRQIQMLLLNLGIPATVTDRVCRLNGRGFQNWGCSVYNGALFGDVVGFGLERKQKLLEKSKPPAFMRNQANAGAEFLGYPVMWCRVKEVESGYTETYDLHVPSGHAYWANGLIVHNTFEGSLGWYPERWRKWQHDNPDNGVSFSMPTWSNVYIYPGGEDDPEIKALKATYPPAMYQERFGAVPCPPSTLVFPEFRWDIHTQEDIIDDWENFDGEIEIAVDPGYNNPYAVLAVHRVGNMVQVVDEIYCQYTLGEHIIRMAQGSRWWRYVTGGVIDVTGRKHEAQKSQIEIWEELTGLHLRSQFVPIEDGISRYRSFLDNPGYGVEADQIGTPLLGPRIVYDRRCTNAIVEHGKYKYRDVRENRSTAGMEKPIDANNHALKAMSYYLVDVFGYVPILRGIASQYQPKFPRRRRVPV